VSRAEAQDLLSRVSAGCAKAGAGVRIASDRPMERFALWSIRPTRCPEPFIRGEAEPGGEFTWRITDEFYAKQVRNAGPDLFSYWRQSGPGRWTGPTIESGSW
jgi:hypothetical protein